MLKLKNKKGEHKLLPLVLVYPTGWIYRTLLMISSGLEHS